MAEARDMDAIALLKADHRTVSARKAQLTEEYKASGIPAPELKTMEGASV